MNRKPFSNEIMLSVNPKICSFIMNDAVSEVIIKSISKLKFPIKVYLYCLDIDTDEKVPEKIRGKVVGEFECRSIQEVTWYHSPTSPDWKYFYNREVGMSDEEIYEYTNGRRYFLGTISDLIIYQTPKELSDFYIPDYKASEQCKYRYFSPTHTRYAKQKQRGGYLCKKNNYWCEKCLTKPLTRPFQSWGYVRKGT